MFCSDNFYEIVENMDSEYLSKKQELMQTALANQLLGKEQMNELEDYYKTTIFVMDERFQEASAATHGEYLIKRDEQDKKVVFFQIN